MHLQMAFFFPNPAKHRLYHFFCECFIFQHGKCIGMKATEPVGKYLFKYLLITLCQRADKTEVAQFQIAGLKVSEITKLYNKTHGKEFTLNGGKKS